jgi:hypothetical protein
MLYGDDAYFLHYDWLRSIERTIDFREQVIGPMHTSAIALSDGESDWRLDAGQLLFHTNYHDVSSYIEKGDARSDYVPYHSAVNMDNIEIEVVDRGWDYVDYSYINTHTSYFDLKISNPRDLHHAPDYAVQQAIEFVIEQSRRNTGRLLMPIIDLILRGSEPE